GFYRFRNSKGKKLNISYSMLGFQIVNKSIPTTVFINKIFVPRVVLYPQTTLIPEVRVVKVIPVVDRGDTIQFNMSAFSFPEHSLLEERSEDHTSELQSLENIVYSHLPD